MSYGAQRCRLSMSHRFRVYEAGQLPQEAVWGLRPWFPSVRKWQLPQLMDAASLIVDAVYITFPDSVKQYLREHPNPKTRNGEYAVMAQCPRDFYRRYFIVVTCRRHWRPFSAPGYTSSAADEACRRYLTVELIRECVRALLHEFRSRDNGFATPFPVFHTPQEEYEVWERKAIRFIQHLLRIEAELC